MARLWTAGAETGDLRQLDADYLLTFASDTAARTGEYAYAIQHGQIVGNTEYCGKTFDTGITEMYMRFAVYIDDGIISYSISPLYYIYDLDVATVRRLFEINYDGGAQAISANYYSSAQVAVALGERQIRGDCWNVLEWHMKVADAPDGLAEWKFNGQMVQSVTGVATNSVFYNINDIRGMSWKASTGVLGGAWFVRIDDIALNDATGSYQNSKDLCGLARRRGRQARAGADYR